jgi:hypothetical protein
MKENGVFKWIAGALVTAMLAAGGMAYTDLRDEIRLERARVDFYSKEIGIVKTDVVEEREKRQGR